MIVSSVRVCSTEVLIAAKMRYYQYPIILVHFLFVLALVLSNPNCPKTKDGMINVHLVSHTHDDVGWLKTVDQYYYGARKHIATVGVQYILDSVLVSLEKDPSRKFIYVESAFFHRWWLEQTKSVKSRFRNLVYNGQLEFIGGGWCMNDEAAAHYNAIIDQMSYGLRLLRSYFGEHGIPRVAWQIDPFGHSKEQASLFAQMGFDGLFLGRIDHADKTQRWADKTMEMVWKASSSLGAAGDIFTGILPRTYSPPPGYCFDIFCGDDPIMDDPALEDYNLDTKVGNFVNYVLSQQEGYMTPNLIMTMGEDFNYVYAESWYKNLDKLIKGVNVLQDDGGKINLMYSTPSCYLDALHASNLTWPTKEDDFFPYSSDPHAYWTGYFTSRPALKGYIRYSNNILQAAKQILALNGRGLTNDLKLLMRAMSVAQHHDAVTGTAKQHVTDDYNKRLSIGVQAAFDQFNEGFNTLLSKNNKQNFVFCPLLNVTACPYTENIQKGFSVTVYNPLAHNRTYFVRIPIAETVGFKVTNDEGNSILSQIVPIPDAVTRTPGRESSAKFELVFEAKDIPPLGIRQYVVYKTKSREVLRQQSSRPARLTSQHYVMQQGDVTILLDAKSKTLQEIGITKPTLTTIKVNQEWMWYAGENGDNSNSDQRASGAYIFRPNGTEHSYGNPISSQTYDGDLVSEVHQIWSSGVSQVIRLYKGQRHIEIEWLVGPIDVKDRIGKEIVSRVTFPDMKTNNTFYTDSNGRQLLKRIKNYRPTWKLSSTEPISQNYYPVTSRIMVKSINGKGEAVILNDRAQGGTSMGDGEMELMTHRRLLHDDAFGVGEALNETAFGQGLVVRGKHYLTHSILGLKDCDFACQHRSLAQEILLQPIVAFASLPKNKHLWWTESRIKKTLVTSLPPNIHLLTMEPIDKDITLVRLEHFYEKGESKTMSSPVIVDLQVLFPNMKITDIKEMNLPANQELEAVDRLKWKTENPQPPAQSSKSDHSIYTFKFSPMQIRTFVIVGTFK